MDTSTPNRYLAGNFAPVHEEVTALDLPVTGRLPEALNGRYLRNGPNPVVPPEPGRYHWFIGDGMVHGVRLRDGRAEWYRNRYVRSRGVAEALGEPYPGGAPVTDLDFAANTNVIVQGGRTFAIVEGGARPYELDDELRTVGACDFDGTLPNGYTAHPKRDPRTGELHALSYWWGWGNKVQYSVIDRDAHVRRLVDVEVKGAPMMHDFSLTEGNVVIYDLPVVFDLDDAMAGGTFPYHWDDAYGARVGVLPSDGEASDVRWFEVDPCYVFHPMNSYDDGTDVVLDVVRHPRMFDKVRNGPDDGRPTLWRWTIDTVAGQVREEQLDDHAQEFPRVDERLVGRRHRFGYAAVASEELTTGGGQPEGGLLRHDLDAGTVAFHSFGRGSGAAEGVFVPSSPDAAEDDGYVVALVYVPERDASDLVVLAAQDFTGEPVARVHLPQRVPFGFHGNWVDDPG
jgi:carotenoid cleavage dioxygenase